MNQPTSLKPEVLCFGEALWDCLPRGLFTGGSPLNATFHLRRLGRRAALLSAVGTDFLGDELLLRIQAAGGEIDYVRRHPRLPTGTVRPSLDKAGDAVFSIGTPAAWDRIDVSETLVRSVTRGACLLHGSLALRGSANRRALRKLRDLPGLYRVFDVNLRPPFDDSGLIDDWARGADLVKLNRDEIRRLSPAGPRASFEKAARALAAHWETSRLCITLDQDGAALLDGDAWHLEKGRRVKVRDTVGAGDAFLAALVHHWILGNGDPAKALAKACRLGEFVATCDGATPEFDPRRFA